jgi:hypothetical protein
MQPDPLHYHDGLNLYADRKNSPLDAVDPSGLKKKCVYTGRSHAYVTNKSVPLPSGGTQNYEVWHCKCHKICTDPVVERVTMDCGTPFIVLTTMNQTEEWDLYSVSTQPGSPAPLDLKDEKPYSLPADLATYLALLKYEEIASGFGGAATAVGNFMMDGVHVSAPTFETQGELNNFLAVRRARYEAACAAHCAKLEGM